jgi:hypothetical protein
VQYCLRPPVALGYARAWGNQLIRVLWIVALCGCATKYQDMGFTGGVAAEQMTADTWRIRTRGNAYTSGATVQDFVFLKAAETTQAAAGTHFQIISAGDASRPSTIVTPGTSTTTVVGRQAFTTSSPGSVDTVIKPGSRPRAQLRPLRSSSSPVLGSSENERSNRPIYELLCVVPSSATTPSGFPCGLIGGIMGHARTHPPQR